MGSMQSCELLSRILMERLAQ